MGPGTVASPAGYTPGTEPPVGQVGKAGRAPDTREGVEAGLVEPHLLEEHDLQPVGKVQALVVWAEGHGEVLRLAWVHDALDRDHAEHALAAVVLSACGPGGVPAQPEPLAPHQSAAGTPAPGPTPARRPQLSSHLPRPCPDGRPQQWSLASVGQLTHYFSPPGPRGQELRQPLLVFAPGAGEAVQLQGELDGQRGAVLQL